MRDVFILTKNGCGFIKKIDSLRKDFSRLGMHCKVLTTPRTAINKVKECFSLDYNHVPRLRSLKVADCIIDPDTRKIKNSLNSVRLSKKEFELLRLFVSNKNVILSRNTIVDNVWGEDTPNPFSNTVDMHVAALRKKLKITGNDVIKTVHGVGYCFQIKKQPPVKEYLLQNKA